MRDPTFSVEDLLWNWVRWCWSGETPGNMARYIPQEDDYRPIMTDHAQAVQRIYDGLSQPEAMVVQAEYTRKNSWFGSLSADARKVTARRWIQEATGAVLRDEDYVRHLDRFKERVGKEVSV